MRLRTAALLAVTSLALQACGTSPSEIAEDIVDGASEAIGEVVDDASGGDGAPSGEGDADPADGGSQDGGSQDAGQDAGGSDGGAPAAAVDDFASVGFHGPAMLRGSVDRLVVEVDTQNGVSVSQSALDHLVATMRQLVDKPGGVVLSGGNSFASDRTQWSSGDLREVASQNRDTASGGGTVSVYVLYVRGGFTSNGEETNAIGVAYNASEMALFPDRWEGLGGLLGSDAAIERAVLVHEWGHLLGLVNIGYESEIDHEDPEHSGHSSNRGSVMYWAIESTLISQIFSGPPPDSFDDADVADLEGIRSGKYRG